MEMEEAAKVSKETVLGCEDQYLHPYSLGH